MNHNIKAIFLMMLFSSAANAVVISFQEGANGYAGNDATYIYATGNANTNFDSEDEMYTGGSAFASLVRFNDVFGSGVNQVDNSAVITNATLTLTTTSHPFSGSNAVQNVHSPIIDWDPATVTFNSFAGATSSAALEAVWGPIVGTFLPNASAMSFAVDITSLVQQWSNGASNFGVLIEVLSGDQAYFYTDNYSVVNHRPMLTVEFAPVQVPAPSGVFLLLLGFAWLAGTNTKQSCQ
ncbi:MAG: DNRLRE domain-containing protein [Pseudomonadales bacterium]|nr:DNRLRE domain-containing protein [Pseudomonadales bacterium]